MQSTPEVWLPIPGYEGFYEVSDLGRVRSVDRFIEYLSRRGNPVRALKKGKILALGKADKYGHRHVILANKTRETRTVHNLVLTTFVGPRPNDSDHCRHLNGDASDNRLENLKWGSRSANTYDSVRHGTHNNASRTHCKWGHEFTPENTAPMTRGGVVVGRRCRACHTRRGIEYRDRKQDQLAAA